MKRIPWGERAAWKLRLEVWGGGFHWDVTERASLCLPPVMGLWGSEMDVEPGRHEAKRSGLVQLGQGRGRSGGSANPVHWWCWSSLPLLCFSLQTGKGPTSTWPSFTARGKNHISQCCLNLPFPADLEDYGVYRLSCSVTAEHVVAATGWCWADMMSGSGACHQRVVF